MSMYDNVRYMGKTLPEWAEALRGQYTLGELYRMSRDGVDFDSLLRV